LSFISQYSKISNAIIFNGGLNNFTIDDNADFYVQVNSNFTKQSIDNIISDTKQNALNSSTNALYINIATSTAGIIISLILTIFLLNMVRKINMSKV
jgi:predicted PurR-regulated permease PerM